MALSKKTNIEIQDRELGIVETKDHISKRLLSGSFLRVATLVISVVVTFYLMPLIVKTLGDKLYGFWSIIGYFIGYYGLLDLGISAAVTRFVSRAIGRNDAEEIQYIATTSLVIFSIVGLLVLILTVLLVIILPATINPTIDINVIKKVIFIMGCGVAISFPMRIVYGLIISKLRYDLFSYLVIGQTLSRFVLILYFLKAGYGIVALAVITVTVDIAGHAVKIFFLLNEYPMIRFRLDQFRLNRVKKLYSYGIYAFIIRLGEQLKFKTSSLVIAKYIALETVTHFEIANRLIHYYRELIMSAVGIMMPVFSRYEGKKDFDSIRRVFLFSTNMSLIITLYMGFSIFCYGDAFIQRWMGPEFADSYYVVSILILGSIIEHIQLPSINLLLGISKHTFYSKLNIVEGIVNLVLCIVFVKNYGMIGAAWAINIEIFIFRLVILPIYVCRVIHISLFNYYIKTVGYTSFKMIAIMAPMVLVVNNYLVPNYFSIFFFAILQTLLAIPTIVYIVINKTDRKLIFNTLQSMIEKAR